MREMEALASMNGLRIQSDTQYEFLKNVPDINETSSNWRIERNRLIQNKKAIRIAADQDHGIRPLGAEGSSVLPQNHVVWNNEIRDNIIGIELEKANATQVTGNTLDNFVANLDEK